MKENNQIKSEQDSSFILKNRMKEIETGKGCGKTIWVHSANIPTDHYRCGDNENLCHECEEKLKFLRQFQKEIKEVQGEFLDDWTKADGKTFTLNEIRNKFKNKFGEF